MESHDSPENEVKNSPQTRLISKFYINSSLHISTLPPEILSYIFFLCMKDHRGPRPQDTSYSHHQSHFTWIKVTHVCRHWRQVALNDAALWSRVLMFEPGGDIERAQEMLRRARQAPIRIRVIRLTSQWTETLRTVLSQVARARELTLLLSTELLHSVADSLPSRAPILRRLHLCQTPANPRNRRIGISRPPLPASFSTMEMPTLEDLRLKRYRVDWTREMLPASLRVLDISHSHDRHSACKFSDIVKVLSTLPLLECLTLVNAFSADTTVESPELMMNHTRRPVSLPQLRKVHLSPGSPFDHVDNTRAMLACLYFLEYLRFSSPIEVSYLLNRYSSKMSFSPIAPALSAALDRVVGDSEDAPAVGAVQALSLRCDTLTFFGRTPDGLEDKRRGPNTFILALPASVVKGAQTLAELCAHLPPLRSVTCLSLRGAPVGNNIAYWRHVLNAMPNIEEITFEGSVPSTQGIIALLRLPADPSLPEHDSESRFTMRYLKEIRFRRVTFSGSRSPTSWSFTDWLCRVLQERAAAKCQVVKLTIEKCFHVTEDTIGTLRELVSVLWDGRVRYPDGGTKTPDEERPRSGSKIEV